MPDLRYDDKLTAHLAAIIAADTSQLCQYAAHRAEWVVAP